MASLPRRESQLESKITDVAIEMAILGLLYRESTRQEIGRRLETLAFRISDTALCCALVSLSKQGLLHSRLDDKCDPPLEYYMITNEGRQIMARGLGQLVRLLDVAGEEARVALVNHPSLKGERASLDAERQEFGTVRSELLSTVSHELRTPLTLIRTSVGLLLDTDADSIMRKRLLSNIKQSADRMHALVTDLLDLVRLNSGRAELQMRYVDVDGLVTGAASLVKTLFDEKRQVLELHVPSRLPKILGDPRRLEQVLLNLLSNANKFAPTSAHVRVSVVEDAQTVVIAVADTGPGIPAEVQVHLFEQFYTGRTSSPRHNIGAGLGLPIAKGIVEAHGGNIWVKSKVGEGSIFYFSLPKAGPNREESDEDTGGR